MARKKEPEFDRNYADIQAVADRAMSHVIEMIRQAKTDRSSKEQEWLEDLRLWACQLTGAQIYHGRANLFIPELNNQVETSVSKFQQGLFPNDDYVNCFPTKKTDMDTAKKIQSAVKYELDVKNSIPSMMERIQRQKVLYGTVPVKGTFEERFNTTYARAKGGKVVANKVPIFRGVRWAPADLFHWYIYPEYSELDTAHVVFDETFHAKWELEAQGIYKNLEKVGVVQKEYSDLQWIDAIRMNIANLTTVAGKVTEGVLVTECWCMFEIEKGDRVPCVITLANLETVIRVQRNPFWHQLPPYLMGRYLKGPIAEAYGHSLPERIRSLQYQMNDLANQTMDSLNFILNPIAVIDPGYGSDVNGFRLQPGAKWWANPASVEMKAFPDISPSGFSGMNQVRSMLQQFSDNTPSLAPQLQGKVRNATAANLVGSEISQNLRNMIRSDETDLLVPMCKMTHSLLQQFQSEAYQIRIQGAAEGEWIMQEISPEDLVGDVDWIWKGSSVSQKTAVRGQQLLSFFNLAVQMNAQMPGQVDLPLLFQRVAKESFEINDLYEIFPSERAKYTVDPEAENLALDDEQEVEVNAGDVFEEHMPVHEQGFNEAKSLKVRVQYMRHMEKHRLQKQARDKLMAQQAEIAAQKMTMGEEGAPQPMQAGPGNKAQTQNPGSDSQVFQGMRGAEPNI